VVEHVPEDVMEFFHQEPVLLKVDLRFNPPKGNAVNVRILENNLDGLDILGVLNPESQAIW
jgi:hypothetical protein